jgi:hypothetical protein
METNVKNFHEMFKDVMTGYPNYEVGTCDIDGSEKKALVRFPVADTKNEYAANVDYRWVRDGVAEIAISFGMVDANNQIRSYFSRRDAKKITKHDDMLIMLDTDGHHWYIMGSDDPVMWEATK